MHKLIHQLSILKEDGIPIGNTQLFHIHPWSKHAECGIWIGDKRVWGQGYATEATSLPLLTQTTNAQPKKLYKIFKTKINIGEFTDEVLSIPLL